MDSTGRQLNQTEAIRFGRIDQNNPVWPIITDKILHSLTTDQGGCASLWQRFRVGKVPDNRCRIFLRNQQEASLT
ncbi:hypothetical protein A8M46_26190 [Escherichia coli]|nr:hypothetical protein A8M46_26190 [Escherichia coli]